MPSNPTRDEIKQQVIDVLTAVAEHFGTVPDGGVKENHSLSGNLNFTVNIKMALAVPFNKRILSKIEGAVLVKQPETKALTTVAAAVSLVFKRANGISTP